MTFGQGNRNFLVDNPTAVAQAVYTRLCLWRGEWWLNLREGTPWLQQVLGNAPDSVPDSAIRARITETPYVTYITDYASTFSPGNRNFTVSCKLYTAFGQVTVAPEGTLLSPAGALVMPLLAVSTDKQLSDLQTNRLLPYARSLPAPDPLAGH